MKNNNKKHNGIISLWKFIFAICILILHCDAFASPNDKVILKCMAFGVEFFFIVSGYLLARSAFNNKKFENENIITDTWHFIFNKIRHLYPFVFIGTSLALIIMITFFSRSIYSWLEILWSYTLLVMTGLGKPYLNTPIWYISSMLLAMLIIYPLLRKYKDKYSKLIAPIIIIFLSGYIYHNYNNLHAWDLWIGWTYKGTLRAFLSLNIGVVVYELCEKMKNIEFTFLGRFLLTVAEISLFIITILAQHFLDGASRLDFYWLTFVAIAILIAFSEKTLTYKFCCNKFFYYLEKLSLPLYLNQAAVVTVIANFDYFRKYNYVENIFITIVVTIFISICTLKVVDYWNNKKEKIYSSLKKLIVK